MFIFGFGTRSDRSVSGSFTGWITGRSIILSFLSVVVPVCISFLSVSAFAQTRYSLEITGDGKGEGGATLISGNNLLSGEKCSIEGGSVSGAFCNADLHGHVAIVAEAREHSTFAGWSGDCDSITGGFGHICNIDMNLNKKVSVKFDRTFLLTLRGVGAGSGRVVMRYPGRADSYCKHTGNTGNSVDEFCSGNTVRFNEFTEGGVVELTARPLDADSIFSGWSVSECDAGIHGDNNEVCRVTMNSAKTITAAFNPVNRPGSATGSVLTIQGAGEGMGQTSLTSTADDIAGGKCTVSSETSIGPFCAIGLRGDVSITAEALPGSEFVRWTHCDSTSGARNQVCHVNVNTAKTIRAEFRLADGTLAIRGEGDGVGQTSLSFPANGIIGGKCTVSSTKSSGPFCTVGLRGDVSITAEALPGSEFVRWTNCDSTSGAQKQICHVNVKTTRVITAIFDPVNRPDLTDSMLKIEGAGNGTGQTSLTSPANGITGGKCTVSLTGVSGPFCVANLRGDVSITAEALPGSEFVGWTHCDSTSGAQNKVCHVNMNTQKVVTATFNPVNHPASPNSMFTIEGAGDGVGQTSLTSPANGITGGKCTISSARVSGPFCAVDLRGNVSITAEALPGSEFFRWTNCDSTSGAQNQICHVNVDSVKMVRVKFRLTAGTLVIRGEGNGVGQTSVASPADNVTNGKCDIYAGETSGLYCIKSLRGNVSITAEALPGSEFIRWTHCDSTSGAQNQVCHVNMNTQKVVTARFDTVSGKLTITQEIDDPDATVSFTSNVPGNTNFSLSSSNGMTGKVIENLGAGIYEVTAKDMSFAGYELTGISCNDDNSSVDLSRRTAKIVLSANENVSCSFKFRANRTFTSQMVADYLGARNTLLLANQPDRNRRIDRLKDRGNGRSQSVSTLSTYGINLPGNMPFSAKLDRNTFSFSSSLKAFSYSSGKQGKSNLLYPSNGKWDIWLEGKLSRFSDKSSNGGSFGVFHAGVDYLVKPDALLGFMFQYDRLKQEYDRNKAKIKGNGWMIGPYATLRLDDNYYLDIRAAWGRSRNRVEPFGSYEDSFKTSRWLVSGALIGDWQYKSWTIRPGFSFQYIEERQSAYTDNTKILIPSQTVSQGDIRLGPRISYRHPLDNGKYLVPWIQFEGVYGFGDKGKFSTGSLAREARGLTGRVEAGFDLDMEGGITLSTSGKYTGIGSRARSYGVSIALDYQF